MRAVSLFEHAERAVGRLPLAARRPALRAGYVLLRGWWMVRRPHTRGVKVVVRRGDEVLLVRHTYGRRAEWDLPGGFVGDGEEPVAAARRELGEELGLDAGELTLLGTMLVRFDGKRDTVHGFACDSDHAALTLDEAEIAHADWFDRAELPEPTSAYTRRMVARAYWELFRTAARAPSG